MISTIRKHNIQTMVQGQKPDQKPAAQYPITRLSSGSSVDQPRVLNAMNEFALNTNLNIIVCIMEPPPYPTTFEAAKQAIRDEDYENAAAIACRLLAYKFPNSVSNAATIAKYLLVEEEYQLVQNICDKLLEKKGFEEVTEIAVLLSAEKEYPITECLAKSLASYQRFQNSYEIADDLIERGQVHCAAEIAKSLVPFNGIQPAIQIAGDLAKNGEPELAKSIADTIEIHKNERIANQARSIINYYTT